MGKKKHPTAGTIRKGSIKHTIYEAMITYPSDTFTCQDIYKGIEKDHPEIKLTALQNMIGFIFVKMKIVKKTDKTRESAESGRKLVIYERVEKAKQPLIYDPEATDRQGNKVTPKRKYTRRKKPGIPAEIDALQLGEAVIDYIKYLQSRVTDLALDVRTSVDKSSSMEKSLQQQVNAKQYEIDGLKKQVDDLTKKLASKQKTFSTKDVLDFQKRKAESSGIRS